LKFLKNRKSASASKDLQPFFKKELPADESDEDGPDESEEVKDTVGISDRVEDTVDFSEKVEDTVDFSEKVDVAIDFSEKVDVAIDFSEKVDDTDDFREKVEDTVDLTQISSNIASINCGDSIHSDNVSIKSLSTLDANDTSIIVASPIKNKIAGPDELSRQNNAEEVKAEDNADDEDDVWETVEVRNKSYKKKTVDSRYGGARSAQSSPIHSATTVESQSINCRKNKGSRPGIVRKKISSRKVVSKQTVTTMTMLVTKNYNHLTTL
jgi:hypothetical protein